jgi:hypothetical protein
LLKGWQAKLWSLAGPQAFRSEDLEARPNTSQWAQSRRLQCGDSGAAAYALMRDGFAKIMVANSANGRSPLNRRAWRLADFTLAAPSYGRFCETTCAPPRLQTAMLGSFIQSRHAPPRSLQPASQTPPDHTGPRLKITPRSCNITGELVRHLPGAPLLFPQKHLQPAFSSCMPFLSILLLTCACWPHARSKHSTMACPVCSRAR